MQLNVIIPCAPHDVSYVDAAISSVTISLCEVFDLKDPPIDSALVHVIFDGKVDMEQRQSGPIDENVGLHFSMFEKPHGTGVARNYGLALTNPDDLVAFMDADDIAFPWCYPTRLKWYSAAKERGDRFPFIYSQCMYMFKDPQTGRVLKNVREVVEVANIRGFLEQQNVILTTSILCQARLLQRAGGFEPYMICGEDGCLWRRVVGINGIGTPVPVPLVTHVYIQRPDSQCRKLYAPTNTPTKMFHLEPGKHGPMGQSLDVVALMRGEATTLATPAEMVRLLTGDDSLVVL